MSVYSTIPGIGGDGDGDQVGPPYVYRGSHILPDEDDPRGGTIGLAVIPSHITRDGRDDQPEDGTPWPWLRMSIDTANDDPAVILNPAQARHLAGLLTAWADQVDPQPADMEHCTHYRDAHDQHHTQPVARCPWCKEES